MKLEYTNTYKYLGETLNHKGNMENHIPEIKRKTEAAYQTILTILGNQHFNNLQMETAWTLIETCIQPIITYGGKHNTDTGKHNTQDTHGTPIYSNWTLIYRVGAAGHHNDNNQKQNKHGKRG